jgi:response regulator NasT
VERFEHFRQVSEEAASLRQALEDRKVIERAKGIVMKRLQVDEEDAFRRLRKVASNSNRKVIEVAQEVVGAEDLFKAAGKM